ncbi:ABC-three component system protein [Bacillus cereus group sp. BfR-BA-01495]|uniref:ABC-three component system protein n=1 Tax=Bacillus cereus group sp. BfR-BA-01495 TaxID=2920363 RepID=UPI001F5A3122|nr:ABC-three component system protein [Bacillus cereus group sp. BfR-BA-01495]
MMDYPSQQANSIHNIGRDQYNQFNYHDSPIIIDPIEMGNLINSFYENIDQLEQQLEILLIKRTEIHIKNELNGMSDDYFETAIKEYLPDFEQIRLFLGDSRNRTHNKRYKYIVREINAKLSAYKNRYPDFNEAFEVLISNYVQNLHVNFEKKTLVRTFFAYMYFTCDVGKNKVG